MPVDHQSIELNGLGELRRKALHVLALLLPLFVWYFGARRSFPYLLAFAFVAVGADYLRVRSVGFNRMIDSLFGALMRGKERPAPGGRMVINGATWVLLSLSVLLFVFESGVAIISFSLFMVGDAAAAIVGRRLGSTYWGRPGCTVEGSLACMISSLAVAVLLGSRQIVGFAPFDFPVVALVAGSAAACITEALPIRVNDNLTAPFAAGLTITLITAWISGSPIELFRLL